MKRQVGFTLILSVLFISGTKVQSSELLDTFIAQLRKNGVCGEPLSLREVNKIDDFVRNLKTAKDRVAYIDNWDNIELFLKSELKRRGYQKSTVVTRLFEPDRFSVALKTGSDRDSSSHMWNLPSDASPEMRRRSNIADARVIYASTLNVKGRSIHAISLKWPDAPPLTIKELYGSLESRVAQSEPGLIMAVYDPTKIRRASELEYWFLSPPKESLLFFVVKDPSSWNF